MVLTYLEGRGQAFNDHEQNVIALFPLLAFFLGSFLPIASVPWPQETARPVLL